MKCPLIVAGTCVGITIGASSEEPDLDCHLRGSCSALHVSHVTPPIMIPQLASCGLLLGVQTSTARVDQGGLAVSSMTRRRARGNARCAPQYDVSEPSLSMTIIVSENLLIAMGHDNHAFSLTP